MPQTGACSTWNVERQKSAVKTLFHVEHDGTLTREFLELEIKVTLASTRNVQDHVLGGTMVLPEGLTAYVYQTIIMGLWSTLPLMRGVKVIVKPKNMVSAVYLFHVYHLDSAEQHSCMRSRDLRGLSPFEIGPG